MVLTRIRAGVRPMTFLALTVIALPVFLGSCADSLLSDVQEARLKGASPIISLRRTDGTKIEAGGVVDFGSLGIGESGNISLVVENTGESNLKFPSDCVSFDKVDGMTDIGFSVVKLPAAELEPGATSTLELRFTPKSAGAVRQTISIAANDKVNGTFTFICKGTGISHRLITFHANGGSGSMTAQEVNPNSTVALNSNAFSRTGYSFDGWATTSEGGKAYNDGQNVSIGTSSLNLYARWIKNDYKVTFLPNIPSVVGVYSAWTGTTGTMSDQSFAYDTSANLWNCGYSRAGYTFAGWTPNPNSASPTVYANMAPYAMGAGDVILYATWQYTGAPYALGSTGPGGGKIIYDKGSYSDGWRYMEAAAAQAGGTRWCGPDWIYVYAATSGALGSGKQNTKAIIDELGLSFSYGARYCAEYVSNGFNDWFMPSRDEVERIKIALNDIGYYTGIWSSTLSDPLWAIIGNDGVGQTGWGFSNFRTAADNVNYYQRPVRRF